MGQGWAKGLPRVRAERLNILRRCCLRGVSLTKAAEAAKCSRPTVSSHYGKFAEQGLVGKPRPSGQSPLPKGKVAILRRAWARGKSSVAAGKLVGVSRITAWKYFNRFSAEVDDAR
jgi:hypothetical protein